MPIQIQPACAYGVPQAMAAHANGVMVFARPGRARAPAAQPETRGSTWLAISSIWRRSSPTGQKWTRWQPARA
jgi:hypothetical protein